MRRPGKALREPKHDVSKDVLNARGRERETSKKRQTCLGRKKSSSAAESACDLGLQFILWSRLRAFYFVVGLGMDF